MIEKLPPQRGRFLPSLLLARWRWVFLLALLLGIGGSVGLVLTRKFSEPKRFESRTLLEFNLSEEDDDATAIPDAIGVFTSDAMFRQVAAALQLGTRWEVKDEEELVHLLRGHVQIRHRDGSDLVEVSCWHFNAVDARDVVNGLLREYGNRVEDSRRERALVMIEVHEAEARALEGVADNRRKLLVNIIQAVHAPEGDDPAAPADRVVGQLEVADAKADYEAVREELAALKSELSKMRLSLNAPVIDFIVHEAPQIPKMPRPLWNPRQALGGAAKLVTLALGASLLFVLVLELLFPARVRA